MKKLLFIILLFIIASCTTTKYVEVPVEVEKTSTELVYKYIVDTTIIVDSVDRYRSGDTTYIYKEKTKIKVVNSVDTIIKTDSIPYPVEITTTVEKEVNKIYWYQYFLIWIGIISLLVISIYAIIKLKFKK
jgi:hypothetical protein